jgi:hypothetical protein
MMFLIFDAASKAASKQRGASTNPEKLLLKMRALTLLR